MSLSMELKASSYVAPYHSRQQLVAVHTLHRFESFFNSTHVALDVLGMCPISPVYKFQRMIHCTVLEIGYGSTNTRISMVALILE